MKFRIRNNIKKSSSQPAKVLDAYKEIISLLKETLDVAWKLAPVALLPAGFMLWAYLRSIHWVELFNESAISGTGLAFLVLAAVVMAFVVIVLFLVPSMIMIGIAQLSDLSRKLPRETVTLYMWALIGWVVSLFANVVLDFPWWSLIALPLAMVTTVGVWKLVRARPGTQSFELLKSCGVVLAHAFGATFVMAGTAFPLAATLKVVSELREYTNEYPYLAFGACLAVSVVSLLPGFMYLRMRTVHTGIREPLKIAAYGTIAVAYFVLTLALMFLPVSSMILQAAGVYSNEASTFQILRTNLEGVMIKAGLKVDHQREIITVSGYVRYNFAGTRLLCRDAFEPQSASPDAVKAAAKSHKPDPGLAGGSHCVRTSSGDLRKFSQ